MRNKKIETLQKSVLHANADAATFKINQKKGSEKMIDLEQYRLDTKSMENQLKELGDSL
ncbi:MAG: hypothetical protein HFI90_01415 [Clostridia bacterium]|nr:hypothetical protein [Clostridia bacterium]